jgi:hypothetical protein
MKLGVEYNSDEATLKGLNIDAHSTPSGFAQGCENLPPVSPEAIRIQALRAWCNYI